MTYIEHRKITLNKLTIANVYFIKKVIISEKNCVIRLRNFPNEYAFAYYSWVLLYTGYTV